MRLLLDECVPRPLLRDLTGHDAHHVVDQGWSSKRNGELLKLMVAEHFEALVTVDRNLPFQQNLRASGIAVVIVVARTNRVKELRPLMPQVLDALRIVKTGEVVSIGE
jgi:predicted nuclease of predicted toxin-antitoxin system